MVTSYDDIRRQPNGEDEEKEKDEYTIRGRRRRKGGVEHGKTKEHTEGIRIEVAISPV